MAIDAMTLIQYRYRWWNFTFNAIQLNSVVYISSGFNKSATAVKEGGRWGEWEEVNPVKTIAHKNNQSLLLCHGGGGKNKGVARGSGQGRDQIRIPQFHVMD